LLFIFFRSQIFKLDVMDLLLSYLHTFSWGLKSIFSETKIWSFYFFVWGVKILYNYRRWVYDIILYYLTFFCKLPLWNMFIRMRWTGISVKQVFVIVYLSISFRSCLKIKFDYTIGIGLTHLNWKMVALNRKISKV